MKEVEIEMIRKKIADVFRKAFNTGAKNDNSYVWKINGVMKSVDVVVKIKD